MLSFHIQLSRKGSAPLKDGFHETAKRRGAIRLYGPSQHLNLNELKDIDGDGRDDLGVFVGRP
jgi:hypothetical protein